MPLLANWNDCLAHQQYVDETNKPLLENWGEFVAFAMMLTGQNIITPETLPVIMVRYNCLACASGDKAPFPDLDPTIMEMFYGTTANVTPESDAVFFRRLAKTVRWTYSDYQKKWSSRIPGDPIHNLPERQAGLCKTCPSHHDQSLVHDGERKN